MADEPNAVLKIDDALLAEVGLGALPQADKDSLRQHIYVTLETNVGMRLADQMSDKQLSEFEQYFEAKDESGAFNWLETNFPNYRDIVTSEFNKLKQELVRTAPQLIASLSSQNSTPSSGDTQQPKVV